MELLKAIFNKFRQNKLKMDLLKCAFRVTTGEFLGFVVYDKGAKVDLAKIKAIIEFPPPTSIRELRGFQGRVTYIRKSISNLSGRCEPFFKIMKKGAPFGWDKDCQTAFDSIKAYLNTHLCIISSTITPN